MGFLVVGQTDKWMPFYATIVTEKTVEYIIGGKDGMAIYRDGLSAMLPFMAGAAPPRFRPTTSSSPNSSPLAARQSWLHGDREVLLTEVDSADKGYDGKTFAEGYRKAKYP